MSTDSLGNPVTLASGSSLEAVNTFAEGFIASQARAADVLAAAQADPSPLVQAYAAAVHMFAEAPGAASGAAPYLQRAQAGAHRATQREQRFIRAVQAWAEGDIAQAIALHVEQAQEHPRDLASLKLGHYHLFNRGDAPGMLRIALACLPAAADVPTCTACWPLPGNSATRWSRPKRPPGGPSPWSAANPGPTMHWPM